MQLYLDQIISSNSGTLQIALPSGAKIKAILTEDPTYSVQNNWGPILPGIQTLSDISQMADSTNIIAFINASSAGWKGTEPLTISVQFILLNYKRGLNIKKQIKELAKMAALEQATNGGGALVQVHGGYSNKFFADNKTLFIDADANNGNSSLASTTTGLITVTIGNQLRIKNLLLADLQVTHSATQVASGEPLFIKAEASFRTYRAPLTSDIDSL